MKEVKETIKPDEVVKKKRQSGKRKPKPKIEDVQKEEVSLNPQQVENTYGIDAVETLNNILTEEISKDSVLDKLTKKVEDKANMEEGMQIEQTPGLSQHANGWQKWLKYQRMTPEDFLKRYPTHKMKHFIEEIVQFNAKKQ